MLELLVLLRDDAHAAHGFCCGGWRGHGLLGCLCVSRRCLPGLASRRWASEEAVQEPISPAGAVVTDPETIPKKLVPLASVCSAPTLPA